MINGEKNDKILFVISDMRLTALHDYILKDLDRLNCKQWDILS